MSWGFGKDGPPVGSVPPVARKTNVIIDTSDCDRVALLWKEESEKFEGQLKKWQGHARFMHDEFDEQGIDLYAWRRSLIQVRDKYAPDVSNDDLVKIFDENRLTEEGKYYEEHRKDRWGEFN